MRILRNNGKLLFALLMIITLLMGYFLFFKIELVMSFGDLDITNPIILFFMFVENITLSVIKNNIFNDLLLNISYLFSNLHYLEASFCDNNIHTIVDNNPNHSFAVKPDGAEGNSRDNESESGDSDNPDFDVQEGIVDNRMEYIEELMAEKVATQQDCIAIEETLPESLKRQREDDSSDDEGPGKRICHREGPYAEELTMLDVKRGTISEIDDQVDSALNDVGKVYKETNDSDLK
jgi:hypothetical protein